MYNLKTLFFFLSLISISLQICHYARDPLPSAGSCICQQAAYSDNGICKLCPNNSYQSSGSATSVSQCDSCQGNSFYLITKATQLSSAICSNCPNNSMNQNMLSTDTQDISVCSYCGSDTYILIPAVQGQPAVCVLCPNNSTTKQGIAKIPGISQCNTCKPGFYISYPATDTQPAICLPCPANTTNQYMYSNPKNNISDCTLCTKGFYQTSQYNAPLTCQKCPLNSTSNGISQIRSIDLCYCDVNYFMIADSKANISAPTCIPCPNGSGTLTRAFQIEDQSYCDICQAGYYMIQSYQDSTSGSPAKAAQCQKCPNNSFSNPGTSTSLSSCSLCFLNYYMTAASKISNEASCTICPDNTGTMAPQSQPGDSTQCNICLPGYYMTSPFQIDKTAICQQCPKGSYSNVGVNTACYCYDINASWSTVNKTCQCNSGYGGIPGTFEGDPSGCILCPEGTYSSSGQCVPCPAGQYSDTTGNTQCQKCQANLYSQGIGNQKCSSCPNNTTILPDQTGCSCNDISSVFLNSICACPDGFTGTPSNSSSQQGCTPCPSGQYSNSQTFGKCTYCAKGDYQPQIGSKSCKQCSQGQFTPTIGSTSCQICGSGSTNTQDFSGCQCYDANSSQTGPNNSCVCNLGYAGTPATSSTSSSKCIACPAGQYADQNSMTCLPCPKGTYSSNDANSSCIQCGEGQYASGTGSKSCQTCQNGLTNNSDFTGCQCYDPNAAQQGNSNTCVCNSGYIGTPATSSNSQSKCAACPAGSYADTTSGSAKCVQCPSGTFSSNAATTMCSSCNLGYFANGTGNTSCQKCGDGSISTIDYSGCSCSDTYSSQKTPADNCICNSGYAGKPGSTNPIKCTACPAGQYADSTSGTCLPCPAGTYSNNTVNSSCTQCGLGQFASGTGNKSCQNCKSGFTNNQDNSDCRCYDQNATLLSITNNCECNTGCIGSPATSSSSQSKCIACPAGQYADQASGKCLSCPVGTYSSGPANSTCAKCQAGQFASGTGNTVCTNCGPGSINTDDFSGCQCYDSNSLPWSVGNNQCICTANFFGDATQATSSDKQKCKACPNNSTSKAGGAKTQNDCSSASSKQDKTLQYNFLIKISPSIFFLMMILL